MTADRLQRLLELAAAASPGPWRVESGPDRQIVIGKTGWPVAAYTIIEEELSETLTPGDAAFIASCREAVPQLAADVIALQASIKRLRELIAETPVLRVDPGAPVDAPTAEYLQRLNDWAPRARAALRD